MLTSLPPASCSMLLQLQRGKLGRRSYEAMLVVQTVLRSRMHNIQAKASEMRETHAKCVRLATYVHTSYHCDISLGSETGWTSTSASACLHQYWPEKLRKEGVQCLRRTYGEE